MKKSSIKEIHFDDKHAEKKSPWQLITIVTFFLLLTLLLVFELVISDRDFSQAENRSLAQKPEISLSSVSTGKFMSRFESYMSDQFPFRDKIVSVKAFMHRVLGATEQNNVYIGSDGWLFENQTKFDKEKASQTTSALSKFSDECKIKNQVFMLVPDSTYFLSDKLPAFLTFDNQAEQIREIHNMLPDSFTKINTVKMFDGVENKDKLYYKTDHHWTTEAAKIAFDFVAEELNADVSEVEYEFHTVSDSFYGTLASSSGIYDKADKIEACFPVDCAGTYYVNNSDTKEKSSSFFKLSKLDQPNKYEVFGGGNFSRITISTTNVNGRNLLILKDSYANCFIPLLTPYFQNIVIIDARYFTENMSDILSDYTFTDMLVLYNVNTFLEDTSLKDIL